MGSLCRCLFLYCCNTRDDNDPDDDSDDEHNDTNDQNNNNHRRQQQQQQSYSSVSDYVNHSSMEGRGLISVRGDQQQQQRTNNDVGLPTNLSSHTIVTVNDDVDDDYDNDREQNNNTSNNHNNNCCRPSATNNNNTNTESSLYDRIRRQLHRFHNSNNNNNNSNAYNVVNGSDDEILHSYYTSVGNNNNNNNNKKKSVQPPPHPSPLRQAMSFNTIMNSEIPCTINNDEIVLPGSLIQQQMADEMRKLSTSSYSSNTKVLFSRSGSTIEECVICMEPFDSSNPRMPTLCNCGVNKTYFHLPCLYQWTEQCAECPSCRTKLTWEEF